MFARQLLKAKATTDALHEFYLNVLYSSLKNTICITVRASIFMTQTDLAALLTEPIFPCPVNNR
jgi:hypothetical protein